MTRTFDESPDNTTVNRRRFIVTALGACAVCPSVAAAISAARARHESVS